MKPERQRLAIAEVCGWRHEVLEPVDTSKVWLLQSDLPDFLHDLNAMHEAEKVLTSQQVQDYARVLLLGMNPRDSRKFAAEGCFLHIHATAAQRAEAFLRTLGLLEDNDE